MDTATPSRARPWFRISLTLALWSGWLACTVAELAAADLADDESNLEQVAFFEAKIRPVLAEHCYRCHAADAKKIQAGLQLDSREASRAGGESGPAVVPHDPAASLLLSALRHESFEMPPDRKLPQEVIADFEVWIADGAIDPRDATSRAANSQAPVIDIQAGRDFWAFRPLADIPPPTVRDATWPESTIDAWLLAKIEEAGIEPAEDTDRTTLIRRVYFDLIGLPPTPDAVKAFVTSPLPDPLALAEVVDELLESKHFGERWGRHWLDVTRFAESSGGGRTLMFPDAWRFRDYVIDAFNCDLPYNEFVRQQIAGDLLPAADWEQQSRQITATAFLVLGPTNYELQDKDQLEMDIVDEQLDTLGKAFLGMTLGCARCHDHKFDPIPVEDYYGLAGIFKSTLSVIHDNVSVWNKSPLPVTPELDHVLREHDGAVAVLRDQLNKYKQQWNELGGASPNSPSVDPQSLDGIVVDDAAATVLGQWQQSTSSPGYVGNGYLHDKNEDAIKSVTFLANVPRSGRYEVRFAFPSAQNRSSKVPVIIQHAEGSTTVQVNQQQSDVTSLNVTSLGSFEFDANRSAKVVITNEGAAPGYVIADAIILVSKESVQRASQLDKPTRELGDATAEPATAERTDRVALRQQLEKQIKEVEAQIKSLVAKGPTRPMAMAVVDKSEVADIPIAIRGVARNPGAIVPRGFLQVIPTETISPIPSEASGRLQLAEWLVCPDNPLTPRVMVNRVWHWLFGEGLVRTVDNFGVMGEVPSHPELLDHLAREFTANGWSVKTLIRQIVLSHAYRLSAQAAPLANGVDPANRLHWRANRRRLDAESIRDAMLFIAGQLELTVGGSNIKPGTTIEYDYQFDSPRRSVYQPIFRNRLPEIFEVFDFADPNIQRGKRSSSTIAPQALLLMNHPQVMEYAHQAAQRLLSSDLLDVSDRIDYCYQVVLGRRATEPELTIARDFMGDRNEDVQRWSHFMQTLFQTLEFRYLN